MDYVVLIAGAVAALTLTAGGVAAWWVTRSVRRMRRRLAPVTAAALAPAARLAGSTLSSSRRPMLARELRLRAAASRPRANPSWWSIRGERRSLRMSVGAAEHSVAAAVAAGAPVGDLPVLCRDLRRVYRDTDRRLMLAAVGGQAGDDQVRGQAAAVRGNAEQIRSLAVRTLTETGGPAAGQLAGRVDNEAAALAEGWSRLRDIRAGLLPS
jgi:hypothetical protein